MSVGTSNHMAADVNHTAASCWRVVRPTLKEWRKKNQWTKEEKKRKLDRKKIKEGMKERYILGYMCERETGNSILRYMFERERQRER